MASNYQNVLDQLVSAGLLVDHLEVGRMQRCRVQDGGAERRGWYLLHELRTEKGDELIVGTYGVWRGNENNATKVEIQRQELSTAEREAIRKRLAEDKKRSEQERKRVAERAADRAAKAWKACSPTGDCDYLAKKGIHAHGVRFSPQGAMVIPMLDVANKIHGLQIIRGGQAQGRRLGKEFWPAGLAKKGHFHLFGGVPGGVLLLAEGYATAASLYEATGLPVAVAFDAGNLAPVAEALHKRYKQARILVCADDDQPQKCQQEACRQPVWLGDGPTCPHCGQPHKAVNAGVSSAGAAAMLVGGAWVEPRFEADAARREAWLTKGQKVTDFNDLHAAEGLHTVREQVQARLLALGWTAARPAAPAQPRGEGNAAQAALRPIDSLDELLERYALVYGQGGTVFDRQEHCLVGLSDMRDACLSRELHRAWAEHPDKALVRVTEVGFDPGETDPNIKCNLWSGWPTTPQAGKCDHLVDLLRYMCAGESHGEALFQWVLRWLAYPIQHPGAKMKTTVVIHGPQGTGKNMFFEAVMRIYGKYGWVIDQSAIEDKFNDWASRKLFLIADEVVARSEMFHIKNKLKSFVTGEQIRINPKNMAAYWEANHVNMVFLSNEAMPVVLEEDDRRHAVIWTPEKLSADFYKGVKAEIDDGGVAALHHHLLHLDLGDFTEATLPPMTEAKRELIDLSMDSPSRFVHAFERGEVEGFPAKDAPKLLMPCLSQDFYELYGEWCRRMGLKALNQPKFVNQVQRKHKGTTDRRRYGDNKNPSTLVHLPGGHEKPPAMHEADWLGERVHAFRMALKDFKALAMGGAA